jgi:peptidoglycan DL-endopeptidase CwlO
MIRLGAIAVLTSVAAIGCAPVSGVVRPQHPMLGGELGRDGVPAPSGLAVIFDDARPDDDDATREARARIARIAGASVGQGPVVVNGERFRMDCSGVARGIYAKAGHRLGFVTVEAAAGTRINDTRVLFELVKQTGSLRRRDPLPGDLVFFDDTYDQNKNGLRDDPLSHVGIVEKVEGEGAAQSVVIVHRVGTNIVRARMTLDRPHERHDENGKPLNHFLRAAHRGEPGKTTAELFVAYGSLPLHDGPAQVASR